MQFISFIRIRTTIPVPGTELRRMMDDGEWIPLSEKARVEEIRNMISLLQGITSYVQSDHMMNLIEDANGKLPEEKETVLSHFDQFLNMSPDDQECFIIGRRTGQVRFLSDYVRTPQLESARDRMKSMYGSIDNAAMELSGRFL
jgi:histone acetyltransferase (RNA polymerase elongator complex component)